jgi:prenyltransferase beta subunit
MYRLSLVLLLCLTIPALSQDKSATAHFLQSLQTTEGGFRNTAGDADARAGLMATAATLRALSLLGAEPRDKAACLRFVRSCVGPGTGGICDRPGGTANVISTAMGLMAHGELGRAGAVSWATTRPAVDSALEFLEKNARTPEEIRMALAGLEAVDARPANANVWLAEVLKRQHRDGSFGSFRDTASAVVIVMRLKRELPKIEAVKRMLAEGQSAEGGYSRADGQPSTLETTYVVGRALHMLGCEPKSRTRCREFIARCRNPDGGYGMTSGQPSQAVATYFALSILHWLEGP